MKKGMLLAKNSKSYLQKPEMNQKTFVCKKRVFSELSIKVTKGLKKGIQKLVKGERVVTFAPALAKKFLSILKQAK